jgi:hypothetical protein
MISELTETAFLRIEKTISLTTVLECCFPILIGIPAVRSIARHVDQRVLLKWYSYPGSDQSMEYQPGLSNTAARSH